MEVRFSRLSPTPKALALCAFLLTAAGAVCMFLPKAQAPSALAVRGEWEIRPGAAALSGRMLSVDTNTADGELMLVDSAHPLPASFPVPSTRSVNAMVGAYVNAAPEAALRQEAVYALCAMEFDHSWSLGARVTEGALSKAQLEERRRDAFRRYQGVLPVGEALEKAYLAAPAPDESEHRTGYAFDIVLLGPLAMSRADPLLRNETGEWLSENMGRYGFIRRFGPDSKSAGNCESIHLRYVGKIHAAAMGLLGLDLEDYLALLGREGAITVFHEGAPWAVIACVQAGSALSVAVPEGGSCSVSSDNMGHAIAAVACDPLR